MDDQALFNPDGERYMEGLRDGVITLQSCSDCHEFQFPPRLHCTKCGSRRITWEVVDGAGTVYAKTINRRAPEEAFVSLLPYAVALVDLDVGVRVMARAVYPADQVLTGMRVVVSPDPKPVVLPGLVFAPLPGSGVGE
jgi:uncharacterized protein